MKQTRLLLLMSALCMTFAGTSLAATTHTGHEHKNEQGTAAKTLQLNAGKKWETDAALRQAMSNIRQAMAGELHEIHENRLSELPPKFRLPREQVG